jgi:hypothetical protein
MSIAASNEPRIVALEVTDDALVAQLAAGRETRQRGHGHTSQG